jgi:hypothetical protein
MRRWAPPAGLYPRRATDHRVPVDSRDRPVWWHFLR